MSAAISTPQYTGGLSIVRESSSQRRARAAQQGWVRRRNIPSLLDIAYDRLRYLIATVDPRIARLYAAEVGAETLPAWEAVYPWDRLPHAALDVAERFAEGKATDKERQAARLLMAAACDRLETGVRMMNVREPQGKAWAACSALGFPLWKRKCPMLAHTLYWVREVTDPSGEMLAHYSKHVAGIERAITNYGRSAR
ncbi:MAG TPA: hypothetical protein VNL35_16690 [Chloroflexota bacterium]|nr:hypothetical protein [Chloroflexota bacterium]